MKKKEEKNNKKNNSKLQRVERQIVKDKESFKILDDLCFKSKNLYNYANYYLRQVFFITGKDEAKWADEEKKFIDFIKEKIDEFNRREGSKNKDYIMSYPSKEFRYLGWRFVDWLIKNEEREDNPYRQLPAWTSQAIIKQLGTNWSSFFSKVKKYKESPEKNKGIPRPPKYKHKEKGRCAVFFNGGNQVKIKYGEIKLPNGIPFKYRTFIDENNVELNQVRIIPKSNYHIIETVYTKQNKKEYIEKLKRDEYKRVIAIDIGVNNFAAITNNFNEKFVLINGKHLKSMNLYYNKLKAKAMSYVGNRGTSNRLKSIERKRWGLFWDKSHKISRWIVNYANNLNADLIVIGYNKGWKQDVDDMLRRNRQTFVQIPYMSFINKIIYKAEEVGIKTKLIKESYTSLCDALALEPIKKRKNYLGKRLKRGLFQSSTGTLINADINGSLNILRKVVGDDFIKEIKDITPIKITI